MPGKPLSMPRTGSPPRIYPAASHAKRTALAIAVAGALLVTGCGDDATSKYRSAAQIAGNDFNQIAGPALRHLSTAPSAPARVAAVEQFKRTLESQGMIVDAWLDFTDNSVKGQGITRNTDYWTLTEFLIQVGLMPAPATA